MDVVCPRCETVYSVNRKDLEGHGGRLQCGYCGFTFETPILREVRRWRTFLVTATVMLSLVLLFVSLWVSRGYLGSIPALHDVIASMGVPWPQDLKTLRVLHAQIIPTPDGGAVVSGMIENTSEQVQAFPRLSAFVTGTRGDVVQTHEYDPGRYLKPGYSVLSGIPPGEKVPFRLTLAPSEVSPGFQVLLQPR